MTSAHAPRSGARRAALLILVALLFDARPPRLAAQTAAAVSAAPASAASLSRNERELAARLKLETVREITEQLSAPAMEGRGTMQPGGDRAAQYIAERYRALDLKPLGDKGTYLQSVKFRDTVITPESSFKVGDVPLVVGRDYVSMPPHSGDENVSGRVVFIGYGVTSPVLKRDDLKGMDVRGKIVMFQDDPPKNVREEDWKKAKATQAIIRNLFMSGAAAIVLAGGGDVQHPYEELADYFVRRQVDLAADKGYPDQAPPFLMVSDAGAEKLFAGSSTLR